MNLGELFGQAWSEIPDLEVDGTTNDRCTYGLEFSTWVNQLVTGIHEPNIVLVNQAKILLQDKFFDWYRFVPNAHRFRLGHRGHICIFQVYERGYERLKNLELSLMPPLLFLPGGAPPIIGGIFLGEDLDRQDDDNKAGSE